jgi:integrase
MTLSDVSLKAARPKHKPYKLFDGGGLYLEVAPSGGRWWRYKYRHMGREKRISLGTYPDTSLQLARQKHADARRLLANGKDPSEERQAAKAANADTFAGIAAEWQQQRRGKITDSTWGKVQWLLVDLLGPHIGSKPIAQLKPADVLRALRRIEASGKHETAHRARQVVGQVCRFAVATGRSESEPTAALRGALVPVAKTARAAITDPRRVAELLRAIDGYQGQPTVTAALRLAPLVFVRPGELRGARWEEFDLKGKEPVWRIPAERMKMGEPHIVPLSAQSVKLLQWLLPITGPEGLLFPSLRSKARPISDNTLNACLRRLGYAKDEMTAHGFRAVASTLLTEQGFADHVIELQLAHAERNEVKAAYRRDRWASLLPERRRMMQAWADYLDGLKAGGHVVPIKRKA